MAGCDGETLKEKLTINHGAGWQGQARREGKQEILMRGRGRRGECNEGRREGGREGRGEEHAKQKEAAGAGGR